MSSTPSTDPDLRAAQRTVAFVAVALVAVLVGVLVVAVTTVTRDDQTDTQTIDADPSVRTLTEIGPPRSVDVATYIEARQTPPAFTGKRIVVVSFIRYLDVPVADSQVPESIEVHGRLVAIPGGEPAFVSGNLDDWRVARIAAATEELANIRELASTVEDADFAAFYRREIARFEQFLNDRSTTIVFGLVISATADESSGKLAGNAEVRLLDVGEGARLADGALVVGLRPEEVALTGEPAIRP